MERKDFLIARDKMYRPEYGYDWTLMMKIKTVAHKRATVFLYSNIVGKD